MHANHGSVFFSHIGRIQLCSIVGPRPALALHRGTFATPWAKSHVSPVHFLLQTPIVNVSVSLETIVRRSSLKKEDESTIKITSVILENTYHMKKSVEDKGVVLDMDF